MNAKDKFINFLQRNLNSRTPKKWMVFWIFGMAISTIIMLAGICISDSSAPGFFAMEFLGVITCIFFFFYYVYLPVERNQLLYGGSSTSMFACVTILVVSLLFAVAGVNSFLLLFDLGFSPSELLGSGEDNNTYSEPASNFWAVVSQFADPGNLPSAMSNSRVMAIVLASLGIFFLSGLLMSSLVDFLSKQRENWLHGLILYDDRWSLKNYVVIIGINEQTSSIITRSLRRNGVEYVLVQTRKDVERTRMDLGLSLEDELEGRVVYYSGERTSAEDVAKLKVERAVEVYILGENIGYENEEDHDSFNLNCLEHLSEYIKYYKSAHDTVAKKLRIHVDFEYQSTFTAFKATNLFHKLDRDTEFVPFNIHEIWSKKVLVDNFAIVPSGSKGEVKLQRYFPIDSYIDDDGRRVGITKDCDKSVHLIVFGMNQMGTALATQAAMLCHFPNFFRDKSLRTTISFIDDHAKVEADYFMGRFSSLFDLSRYRIVVADGSPIDPDAGFIDPMANGGNNYLLGEDDEPDKSFLDIQWEFIQGNIASKTIKDYVQKVTADPRKTTTVAICFNHSQVAIASAMYLPADIFKHANQVLVYQQNIFDVVNDVSGGDSEWNKYQNLLPFGMIESSYTENQYDNTLAKLEHYYYYKGIKSIGSFDTSKIVDSVDSCWNELGIVQKLANIDSVDSIPFKVRSLGVATSHDYTDIRKKTADINLMEMKYSEHLRWVTERLICGYRALTEDEQREIVELEGVMKDNRSNSLKVQLRAHLDICSNSRLSVVDYKRYSSDGKSIKGLPDLVKDGERINALRLYNERYARSQHVAALREFFGTPDAGNKGNPNDNLFFHFIPGIKKEEETLEGPRHSFWMAETTVTREQWKSITGQEKKNRNDWLGKDMPVVNVSKADIEDFLDILRKRTGLYFNLPSIKEWRYAAALSNSEFYAKASGKKAAEDEEKELKNMKAEAEKQGKSNIDDIEEKLRLARKKIEEMTLVKSDYSYMRLQQDAPEQVRSQKNLDRRYPLHHMLGNVWEWTTSKIDGHARYEFCGASFRFQINDAGIEHYGEKDPDQYWHAAWEEDMKSDDLGFRLIWKFDEADIISGWKDESSDAAKEAAKVESVKDWFKKENHGMKKVKSGQYIQGTNSSDDTDGVDISTEPDLNETPEHEVYFSHDYYVCQVPVTQELWNIFYSKEKNPTTNRLCDNLPQTNVDWDDVNRFIDKLNDIKKTGKLDDVLPEATKEFVFRLPTESEWEIAAKGGVEQKDFTLYSGSDISEEVAWYNQPGIQEVAKKQPNQIGLYDMSGNVWEWCYDYYIFDMYPACMDHIKDNIQDEIARNDKSIQENDRKHNNITDPVALDTSYSAHVFRGGSWKATEWDCRCTRANFWIANHKSNDLGFRLVLGRKIVVANTKKE